MHTTNIDIAAVLGDIVVDPAVLEKLGAAMNSGRAIFVHGPVATAARLTWPSACMAYSRARC
ncbi:hypothetical protein LP420_31095 [Massilia sp. B-10]|nr:hypothetical protein LP420_31095 [Massilia sp. B-10]